jgi:hypothetical protein
MTTGLCRPTAIMALWCAFTAIPVEGATLSEELRRRAADEGLALARIRGESRILTLMGEFHVEANPMGLSEAWLSNGAPP